MTTRDEINAALAVFADATPATPRGILRPGGSKRDKLPARPKRPASYVGTLLDDDVKAALATVRAAYRKNAPGIAASFVTNNVILRSALLAYAKDFTD